MALNGVHSISDIKLPCYDVLKTTYTPPKVTIIDLLWHSVYLFKKCRRGWSDFMYDVSVGEHDGKEDFTMLPIIDLDPNDYLCIYSTLVFILNQAKKLNIRTPCLTFDLPLWLKSMDIANAKSFDVVLILGGFHTNLDLECLDPTKWGWKFEKGHLVPIKTNIPPAPAFLLNFIRCKC